MYIYIPIKNENFGIDPSLTGAPLLIRGEKKRDKYKMKIVDHTLPSGFNHNLF
jgi:hypothetical protein